MIKTRSTEIVELIERFTKLWFKASVLLRFTNDILPEWEVLVEHYYKSGYLPDPKIYTEKGADLYDVLKTLDSRIRNEKDDTTGRVIYDLPSKFKQGKGVE